MTINYETCDVCGKETCVLNSHEGPVYYSDRCEYESLTELDWFRYEFATLEYDYKIHPDAARSIEKMFERMYDKLHRMKMDVLYES